MCAATSAWRFLKWASFRKFPPRLGPGQNEVVFRSSDALSAADNFMTFKSVVKQAASVSGLYASFMPKPFETEKSSALGLMFEVYKDGKTF